jgi:hypothetical protein
MVKAAITMGNGSHTLRELGGDMTRSNLYRLAAALGSLGSLVAVVGAGTKWGF